MLHITSQYKVSISINHCVKGKTCGSEYNTLQVKLKFLKPVKLCIGVLSIVLNMRP
jgi:hypothetical protein